jgi:hypothetical protein
MVDHPLVPEEIKSYMTRHNVIEEANGVVVGKSVEQES